MTADEWNAKHPIGTRVLAYLFGKMTHGFTTNNATCITGFGNFVCVEIEDRVRVGSNLLSTVPISAYPGDMYTPMKKVHCNE